MPIKVSELKNGHNPEVQDVPPTVEAEVVEDVYASQAEVRPDLEDFEPRSELPKVEIKLRSFIPETKEDYEAGFKLLRDKEFEDYSIPLDRSLYRTREDAAKNILKVSPSRVGEHLTEITRLPFPRNYLIDAQGLTPQCIWELLTKIDNTARSVPPGAISDWHQTKPKTKKVFNPKYKTHRFKYWEEVSKRCAEYQAWFDGQPQPDVEVHDAEFVTPNEPEEDREERLSKKRSAIELAERSTDNAVREYMRWKREQILKLVEEESLETKLQIDIAHTRIINQPDTTAPPDLEEDEDL